MQSYIQCHGIRSTVNREIFVIEIFSDTMDNLKIKHMKKLTLIWYRVFVQKLFNTQIYRMKNILTQNICDLRYIDKMAISLFLLLTVVDYQ